MSIRTLVTPALSALALASVALCPDAAQCQSDGAATLAHYRLAAAPTWQVKLAKDLAEISGLAFTADGRLFAHGDQDATIWQIDPRSGAVLKTFSLAPARGAPDMGKPPRKHRVAGDFEDIAVVGDRFYLVSSNGVLLEFGEGGDGQQVPFTAYDTGLGSRCEVEGLASDPSTRALLILCKHSHVPEWKDQIVVAGWSLASHRLEAAPRIRVPYASVARVTGVPTFHGSAIALAPDRRSVIVIAGPQRTFVELGLDGKVLGGGALDRDAHRQPEGLTLAPDGTLLVSDEGAGKRAALAGYARRP
jgi:uncharacterized protein YjiK